MFKKLSYVPFIVLCILLLICHSLAEETFGQDDLIYLSVNDLKQLSSEIDEARKTYHTAGGNSQDIALTAVKRETEIYCQSQGIDDISWPWLFGYDYAKEWNLYHVEAKINYKTADGEKHSDSVVGITFEDSNSCSVFYLEIGGSIITDNLAMLPKPLWINIDTHMINERTGLDLTTLSADEMGLWQDSIKEEIKKNHETSTAGNNATKEIVQAFINEYYSNQGVSKVSWPWISYNYSHDWERYTFKCDIDYHNSENQKISVPLYAEVYTIHDSSEIYYLTLGEQTIINKLPELKKQKITYCQNSILFDEAMDAMNSANYSEALDIFLFLEDYSNSESMTEKCRQAMLQERYNEAFRFMTNGKYTDALDAFLSLSDYSDSEKRAEECRQAILQESYNEAIRFMTSGKYADALDLFLSLNDYSDSEKRAEECRQAILQEQYDQAYELYQNGAYDEAIELYSSISEFKDSKEQITICKEAIKKKIYENAVSAFNSKEYEKAIEMLTSLGEYSDAHELLLSCYQTIYEQAAIFLSGGHYEEACELFKFLGEYADSSDLAAQCISSKNAADREIVFDENEINIFPEKTCQLSPSIQVLKETAPEQTTILYRSEDEKIIKVSKSGVVTALKEGTARIICTAEDNPCVVSDITIHVVLPVKQIKLDQSSITLTVSQNDPASATYQLNAAISPENAFDQTILWETSDENVALVDENGIITAVSPGKATITATAKGTSKEAKKAVCSLKVEYGVSSILLNEQSGTIFIGETQKLSATVLPENAANKNITWSTSDSGIATVSKNGTVKGISSGTATITATASNGICENYTATVKQGPAKFSVTIKTRCIENDHVGNNWTKTFYIDDKKYTSSTTIQAEVGQIIHIHGEIIDHDSNPDEGYFDLKLEMSEEIFKKGYSFEDIVSVRENGGRYSGNYADWKVQITIKKR